MAPDARLYLLYFLVPPPTPPGLRADRKRRDPPPLTPLSNRLDAAVDVKQLLLRLDDAARRRLELLVLFDDDLLDRFKASLVLDLHRDSLLSTRHESLGSVLLDRRRFDV